MKLPPRSASSLRSGFTLMEMMLVLAIIALLIAVVAALSPKILGSAEVTAAQAKISSIKANMLAYKNNNRRYPAQLEHLVKPPSDARYRKPLMDEEGIT